MSWRTFFLAASGGYDFRTLRDKNLGYPLTDAARGPGDDGNFPI